jgi:hypothetical protein
MLSSRQVTNSVPTPVVEGGHGTNACFALIQERRSASDWARPRHEQDEGNESIALRIGATFRYARPATEGVFFGATAADSES